MIMHDYDSNTITHLRTSSHIKKYIYLNIILTFIRVYSVVVYLSLYIHTTQLNTTSGQLMY